MQTLYLTLTRGIIAIINYMLDFCLRHYLLSSDSKTVTLYKGHHSMHYFQKLLTKKLNQSFTELFLRVIPLGLALLYKYYPLAMENIEAHSLILLLQLFLFLFLFYN